jgi:multidrug efflux system membrane fusion protein
VNRNLFFSLLPALLLVAGGGCEPNKAKIAEAKAPAVPVAKPLQRLISDNVDYTGRLNAIDSVNILPRVTGYLVKMPFKEGSDVKKGELLFEIDPRPYVAQFDAAKAQLEQSKASQRYAKATNERFHALAVKEPGAVSQQELDQYQAQEEQSGANVDLAKANLEAAKLNLDWTKVEAPIDGHISRYYQTKGNLVNQDQTMLTTIVSNDPMYLYFDMDEPTLLRIKRLVNEGKIERSESSGTNPIVLMGLEGEDGFPHKGSVNFFDNTVNAMTGSISVRGAFPNPIPEKKAEEKKGTRLFVPGMFARVRFPIGQPHEALLVIDRAIGSDQGLRYVYVVDSEKKVQKRRVTTGTLEEDGMRVILDGLQPDEWVAVGGIQQLRDRMEIQPDQQQTMPTLGGLAVGRPSTSNSQAGKGAPPAKKGKS